MYSVEIKQRARRALARLSERDYTRMMEVIRGLSSNPRPVGCIKLTGRDAWRLRVGVYRIVYEINDTELSIFVIDAGHRREVYR